MKLGSFYGVPMSCITLSRIPYTVFEEGLKDLGSSNKIGSEIYDELDCISRFIQTLTLRVVTDKEPVLLNQDSYKDLMRLNVYSEDYTFPNKEILLGKFNEIEMEVKSGNYKGLISKSQVFKISNLYRSNRFVTNILNLYGYIKDRRDFDTIQTMVLYDTLNLVFKDFNLDFSLEDFIVETVDMWLNDGLISYTDSIVSLVNGINISSNYTKDDIASDFEYIFSRHIDIPKLISDYKSSIERNVTLENTNKVFGRPITFLDSSKEGFITGNINKSARSGDFFVKEECDKVLTYFNGKRSISNTLNLSEFIQKMKDKLYDIDITEDIENELFGSNSSDLLTSILLSLELFKANIDKDFKEGLLKTDIDTINYVGANIGFGAISLNFRDLLLDFFTLHDVNNITSDLSNSITGSFKDFLLLVESVKDTVLEIGGDVGE